MKITIVGDTVGVDEDFREELDLSQCGIPETFGHSNGVSVEATQDTLNTIPQMLQMTKLLQYLLGLLLVLLFGKQN
jgi:hypothetical protein